MRRTLTFLLLTLAVCLLFLLELCVGSAFIPLRDVLGALGGRASDPIYGEIVCNYRLPKALMALLSGAALSVAGLMMQTLFRNPLSGPDVLGVNAGASLGVAFVTMLVSGWGGASISLGSWSLVAAAMVGALLVLLLVLWMSARLPDVMSLLIAGMMFGYLAGAIVNMIQSTSNPEALKLFVVWTFGSVGAVTWQMMPVVMSVVVVALALSFSQHRQMDALLLGERYAAGLGVSMRQTRFLLILSTALLSGVVTAFAGPISFIGLTVPHIARGVFRKWKHLQLLPAVMLVGSSLVMACDLIAQMPCFHASLPLNSVTSLVGAPLTVWIILRNNRRG